jgi:hypothetical protein
MSVNKNDASPFVRLIALMIVGGVAKALFGPYFERTTVSAPVSGRVPDVQPVPKLTSISGSETNDSEDPK